MNIALLTAAGVGSRMKNDVPKQFLHVKNKPIIIHTLLRFQKHPSIDQIIVVTLPAWIEVLTSYAKEFGITKLMYIVAGGKNGQESIYKGLQCLEKNGLSNDDVVLVHDGNRCNIAPEQISDSLSVFNEFGSAVAAIPCVEAVFRSDDGGKTSKTSVPREELYRTQTPHTYTLGKLLWAHKLSIEKSIDNTAATCSLMEALGEKVYFSLGLEANLKITTSEDIKIFKALLNSK